MNSSLVNYLTFLFYSMDKGIVIYDFKGNEANELSVTKNDILEVIKKHDSWWEVKNIRGDIGLVPDDFIAYPVAEDTKIVSRGRVTEAHDATSDNEVTVKINDQVAIFDKTDSYWWYVGFKGKAGYLPKTIIKVFQVCIYIIYNSLQIIILHS